MAKKKSKAGRPREQQKVTFTTRIETSKLNAKDIKVGLVKGKISGTPALAVIDREKLEEIIDKALTK